MNKWFNKQTISMFLIGVLISVLTTCVFATKIIQSEFISMDDLEKQPGVFVNFNKSFIIERYEGKTHIYVSKIPTDQIYFNVEELKSTKIIP